MAFRVTECCYCHQPIEKGSRRYDDVISIRTKETKFYRRLHYHPPCWDEKTKKWFDENQDKEQNRGHGGGRTPLDLSEEDKIKRKKALIKLSGLWQYYMPKLDLQTPTNELSFNAVRIMMNFHHRFQGLSEELAVLGGLPKRYQNMKLPDFSEQLVAVTSTNNDLESN